LAERLADLPFAPGGRAYVPLTVGGHVDHSLVRQAAEMWGALGGEMVYYEDYPYAEHPAALRDVLGSGFGWKANLVPLNTEALDVKAAAITHYRSQISTFFKDTDEIATRVRAYATVVGDGKGWAERFWQRV
jgi:hypothetical protein